jgi:hypothetical protein
MNKVITIRGKKNEKVKHKRKERQERKENERLDGSK